MRRLLKDSFRTIPIEVTRKVQGEFIERIGCAPENHCRRKTDGLALEPVALTEESLNEPSGFSAAVAPFRTGKEGFKWPL
jgi:hypothetical protein